ncbi:MAG: hypothetical protein HOE90_10005 [Bacteriovoracaceae bacterium]|nr:hypothetical protein [Bacteriovoracaceae bacterium]
MNLLVLFITTFLLTLNVFAAGKDRAGVYATGLYAIGPTSSSAAAWDGMDSGGFGAEVGYRGESGLSGEVFVRNHDFDEKTTASGVAGISFKTKLKVTSLGVGGKYFRSGWRA